MKHTLHLDVTIRDAVAADLPKLEWFGSITPFREILDNDFARAERQEMAFLVAEVNRFPVGQAVADFVRFSAENIGHITGLRVLEPFQRCGIASSLMDMAEQRIRQRSLKGAQLGVAKENHSALALYRKRGYIIAGELIDTWGYTDPQGIHHTVEEIEWNMQKSL